MIKGKILIRFAALLWSVIPMTLAAQQMVATHEYPQGYFRNPLGIPMELTANFGELRTNHWHMGLDLRTAQRTGLPIYASAEGFVASIGIRPLSFGRFITVQHPNGYTTLYAHLNGFYPELEKYVQLKQKEKESWAIELSFDKDQFPVRRGALIGYSGNTGGSQGPHLHFEIRDTETGKVLNPLLFGFPINDNIPPIVTRLAIYNRDVSTYNQTPVFLTLKKVAGKYVTSPQSIKTPFRKISFAISAHDRITGSPTNDGIFGAHVFVDDKSILKFEIDNIDYAESVFINARTDYKYKNAKGVHLQHLSKLPGDHAPIYTQVENHGILELSDTNEHDVRIQVMDAHNNVSEIFFTVQYSGGSAKQEYVPAQGASAFIPGFISIIEKRDFELVLQENCLYDTVALQYSRIDNYPTGVVSPAHRVNDPSIPVHCDFRMRLKPTTRLSEDDKQRTLIVREWKGSRNVRKAIWTQEWATGSFSDFGNFQLYVDRVAPSVTAPAKLRDTLDLSPLKRLAFTPRDNFGIRSFRAELNGEWLKFSNDKGRTWIYNFDEQVPYGVHHLRVIVEDIAGNTTVKEWWFKRYPYTPPKKKVVKKKRRR